MSRTEGVAQLARDLVEARKERDELAKIANALVDLDDRGWLDDQKTYTDEEARTLETAIEQARALTKRPRREPAENPRG